MRHWSRFTGGFRPVKKIRREYGYNNMQCQQNSNAVKGLMNLGPCCGFLGLKPDSNPGVDGVLP